MSFANSSTVWSLDTFKEYLTNLTKPSWCKAICMHHTAAPSLAQRPKGLFAQHIKNIQDFYMQKGWKSGPHLFIDEDQIFGMTPLTLQGIHAASFNSYAIGIEVLGDYDLEFCDRGRGLECWKTAAATVKILTEWLDIPIQQNKILFHRDDPKTRKTCPGTRVTKPWFIDLVRNIDIDELNTSKLPKCDAPLQLVIVSEYLQTIKNYNIKDITEKLVRKDDGLYYFDDNWLEGAFYDKTKQATLAPIAELCSIPKKK